VIPLKSGAPRRRITVTSTVANNLSLNHKTVAKAYRLLERDSVIQTKGYRGTFVHPDAKANSTVDLNDWVNRSLHQTISTFREAGVTDSEIRIAFADLMKNRGKQKEPYLSSDYRHRQRQLVVRFTIAISIIATLFILITNGLKPFRHGLDDIVMSLTCSSFACFSCD